MSASIPRRRASHVLRPTTARRLAIALVGIQVLSPGHAAAQLPPLEEYVVRTFGPEHGLGSAEIWDVARDGDGRAVVSSARGLFRYTGYEFLALGAPDLDRTVFRDLEVDVHGRVWFLTGSGEAGYVEHGRARTVVHPPNEPWRLQRGPRGRMWAVGLAGLVVLDSTAVPGYRAVDALAGVRTSGVFRVGSEIIALSEAGAFRLDADNGTNPVAVLESMPDIPTPHSPSLVWQDERGIWYHVDALNDSLILLSERGVTRFGPGDPEFEEHRTDRFVARDVVSGGPTERWMLLMDPDGAGLVLRQRGGTTLRLPLPDHLDFRTVRRVVVDSEGIVWICTDQGLIQLAPRAIHALTERHGLRQRFTAPILETRDGGVWVGTWGGGLHHFVDGRLDRVFTSADGLPSDRIRALVEAQDGRLWIGTGGGVAVSSGDRIEQAWAATEVRTLKETRDGVIWVGAVDGLRSVEGASLVPEHADVLEGRAVHALHEGRDGAVWIGTEHGLYRRDPGGSLTRTGSGRGLRSDWINTIQEEDDGTLWFGTYAEGLYRYRGDRFVPITTAEGLHHDGIWRMLPDEQGGVWMSSDAGLARVDRSELHRVADLVERGEPVREPLQPLVFTEVSGMPSRESNRASPAGWRLSDGTLVFNNLRGVVVVDPARVVAEQTPPGVDVTLVSVDGIATTLADDGGGEVPAGTRHLGVQFASRALTAPEQSRYRVRLDGFDEDWVPVGTRHRVEYTNLSPGAYTLRVQAARASGGWGEAAILPLRLQPEVWQASWFRALVLLCVLGAMWGLHRVRLGRAVETERMRLRIASDLHDDVGANLVSIALLSELSVNATPPGRVEDRMRLEQIHRAASATVEALRDIVWLVDPKNDGTADLVHRMRDLAIGLLPEERVRVPLRDAYPERNLSADVLRNTILVYKEALQNAVKHGGLETVHVVIEPTADRLSFTVTDHGPGFDPRVAAGGYGLENMRRRAADIGATLAVERGPGGGTVVRFSTPLA